MPGLCKYEVGDKINCSGIRGVVVYPRRSKLVTISWDGFDDLDDYTYEWLEEHCGDKRRKI